MKRNRSKKGFKSAICVFFRRLRDRDTAKKKTPQNYSFGGILCCSLEGIWITVLATLKGIVSDEVIETAVRNIKPLQIFDGKTLILYAADKGTADEFVDSSGLEILRENGYDCWLMSAAGQHEKPETGRTAAEKEDRTDSSNLIEKIMMTLLRRDSFVRPISFRFGERDEPLCLMVRAVFLPENKIPIRLCFLKKEGKSIGGIILNAILCFDLTEETADLIQNQLSAAGNRYGDIEIEHDETDGELTASLYMSMQEEDPDYMIPVLNNALARVMLLTRSLAAQIEGMLPPSEQERQKLLVKQWISGFQLDDSDDDNTTDFSAD